MIGLFNFHNRELKMFETRDQLFNYIMTLENEKLFEDHENFGATEWSFGIIALQHVRELYHKIKEEDMTEALREAYEQELPLLEISWGDFRNRISIPLLPDIDLKTLKWDWCRAYCEVHDYYLAEES